MKYLNKQTKISAADCQQAIRDVYVRYKTNLDMFIKKHYKISMYSHPYRFLFNYMVRYFKDQQDFEDFLEKKYLKEKKELIEIRKQKQEKELTYIEFRSLHFYMYLRKIYNDVKAKNFFKGQINLNLISMVRYVQDFIIKKINKVTYKSLTFEHKNVLNSKKFPAMLEKSRIKLTNAIVHINLPKIAIIDLPVRQSKKYHGILKDHKYDSNEMVYQKQYLVKISFDEVKKEVKITLVRDIEKNISDLKDKQILGVDVNTKHNIFALSNYETQEIDNHLVNKIVREKKKLKAIQSQRDKLKLPKEYSKRQRKIQDKINKQVAYLQNYACHQLLSTYKDSILVMENLERGLKKCKFNNKQYEEELNYNDLFSLLRIYSMKDTVIRMSGNYNINVVLVNPDFTSQMCPKCGHISKKNRKSQETFCCEKCNHKNNADINAAKNIKGRFTNPKFKEELQKEVKNTQLISEPKILNRFKFKEKLFEITNN